MVKALRQQPVTLEAWVQSQNGRCRICAEQCRTRFAPNVQYRICAGQCRTRFAPNVQYRICAGQCRTRFAPSTSVSIIILRLRPTLYNLSSHLVMSTRKVTVGKCGEMQFAYSDGTWCSVVRDGRVRVK
jgi:hypothetical protein